MARRVYSLGLGADVRALLGSVSCPALVMASRKAMAAPPLTQAEYLSEHIQRAELAVFDTADSLPYRPEHRAWVNDTIQAFLTGRRPEPSVEDRVLTTVLFTDLVASTEAAARLGDHRWRDQLSDVEAIERAQVRRYKGRLVKTTGDGILATFDGPARAVRCASAITDAVQRQTGISVRAGVHTGEIEIRGADIRGLAVHIAARVMALAGPGQVFASSTVKDLVLGSGITFLYGGEHNLKGVPGSWKLYVVEEPSRAPSR